MKRLTSRRVAAIALSSAALFILGCAEDSVTPPPPPPCKWCYRPLTEKENLIYNLVLCYKQHNLTRYEELLHPDFIWYNQMGVTPEYYTRSEDIEITGNMFDAAENIYPDDKLWLDKLELNVYPSTWQQVPQFNGEPCADCWETTRDYYLVLVMTGGEVTYIAEDLVRFVVAPVDVNGTKIYKIIRCDDIHKPY